MKFEIETSKVEILQKWLSIVNTTFGNEEKLSPTEIEVLGRLLFVDYMYRSLKEEERNIIIFSSNVRNNVLMDIASKNPYFSKQGFNNTIASLKKKGIIVGKGKSIKLNFINPLLMMKDKGKLTITFELNAKDLV